jgi:hypothetical protein
MIMLNSYLDKHPEKGVTTHPFQEKAAERQLALKRYQYLKKVSEEDLTLYDQLFIENFEVAMHFWWHVKL